ncbi:hypothetical protein L7F22_048455 [Adiantum nelumboides]|nr:hypothetical protein [Adiantum nelumboides]
MPIITRNKAKGVDHANKISISMTQESGSTQDTTSIIEPSNITTLDLVPSLVVPTSDTPTVATNEPLSDCFGSLVDSHIFAGWIDSHILPYTHLLPRIPLCQLLANLAIRTQDDYVAELITLIAEQAHHKKVKGKGKSSSATINQPKDAHSPSTAKGRPPRTAKERPSTSKKRPRPAVSESFKSLEEQFELLSREDAKDSKHAYCEQQSDSRRSSPSGRSRADLDDSEATQIKPIHLAVLCDIDNIRMAIYNRRAPQEGLQDICRLLGSLSYTGQIDPNARLGGVRLMWADLPTHCKVDAGFGGVPLWNVFTDGIVQSVFTIAAEFLLDNGTLVVACRAEHLFKVINKAYESQFCHIQTLFLLQQSFSWTMVTTLIVAMFVRDLDGPLPVPFYDRRADDIAADIDGYEADSDMLQEPL